MYYIYVTFGSSLLIESDTSYYCYGHYTDYAVCMLIDNSAEYLQMVEPDFISSHWVCLDGCLLVDNPQSIVARPLEVQLVLPQVLLHLDLIVRPKHVTPAFQARRVTQQSLTSVVITYVHHLDNIRKVT